MTDISYVRPHAAQSQFGLSTLRHWLQVAKTRRDLARLDADALQDIGLSHAEARAESARPVWDAPSRWIKC